jgi:predicted phosphoribosyltransferase
VAKPTPSRWDPAMDKGVSDLRHLWEPFHAIGLYYEDFHQVSDKEVIDLLSKALALEEIGKNE